MDEELVGLNTKLKAITYVLKIEGNNFNLTLAPEFFFDETEVITHYDGEIVPTWVANLNSIKVRLEKFIREKKHGG